MSTHDSTIAARVKQTQDANRKRQAVPFKEGDLVYISTKNIIFAKGLACKLIPKYIGPYKIPRDFDNQLIYPLIWNKEVFTMYFILHYLESMYPMTIDCSPVEWTLS